MVHESEALKQQLFSSIWKSAEVARGAVDGWTFMQYVLGLMFYRFLSERFEAYVNGQERGHKPDFDYASLPESESSRAYVEAGRKALVNELGYFIYPWDLFSSMLRKAEEEDRARGSESRGDEELWHISQELKDVFLRIEASADGLNPHAAQRLENLFDGMDLNSIKLGRDLVDRHARLLALLRVTDSFFRVEGEEKLGLPAQIDLFGDAYEYLIKMYASNAGKSGGEFFTPQEVSELLARIVLSHSEGLQEVYDPACGSGSLLLSFKKLLPQEQGDNLDFFGQEINHTTFSLCRYNMFLHGVGYNHFDIAFGDTLLRPNEKHMAKTFRAIVSNPPYSTKWEGDANVLLLQDERFRGPGVLAPKSKADLAFTMHILSRLHSEGTAAIVEFPGVLYRMGAEGKIRQWLVEQNKVDAVIQLPQNLFFGVSIATCIIVLRHNRVDDRVQFINASEEFVHVGNKNRLSEENIARVMAVYQARKEEEYFSRLVTVEDIREKDFNLSVSAYVAARDTRPKVDIEELNRRIAGIVAREEQLRREIDSIVAELEGENANA